jgi:hypothetical protein
MSSGRDRSVAVPERVLGARKAGSGQQLEIQWRGQHGSTWEAASRMRKHYPQLTQAWEEQQHSEEGAPDADVSMGDDQAHDSDSAPDSAALQRQVAELALLVKQQAHRADEQQKLIKQLRASSAHSPKSSAPASPQRGAGASAAAAQRASQSRFARKEPRTQDLQEYHGAAGAKLDDWLDELGAAVELYELTEREAVAFATSRLRDAARLWWNALGSKGKQAITGVAPLAAALRARFQPVTAAHTARVQLDKLAQGSRSINEYIADFQRLRTRLPGMAEEDALHAFRRGLRNDIAGELRKQRVTSLTDAISLASHVGSEATPASGRSALNQMDVDDDAAAHVQPPKEMWQALLNAMASRDTSGLGAKTQTHHGYTQQRDSQRGGRGGARGGGRGGFRRGPPEVPGVPEQVVRQRMDAQQCIRCGQDGHRSTGCPNAISARGN